MSLFLLLLLPPPPLSLLRPLPLSPPPTHTLCALVHIGVVLHGPITTCHLSQVTASPITEWPIDQRRRTAWMFSKRYVRDTRRPGMPATRLSTAGRRHDGVRLRLFCRQVDLEPRRAHHLVRRAVITTNSSSPIGRRPSTKVTSGSCPAAAPHPRRHTRVLEYFAQPMAPRASEIYLLSAVMTT